jgi:subtilase family protein
MTDLSHLRVESRPIPVPYTHAGGGGGGEFDLPPRDRHPHARRLKLELERVQQEAQAARRDEPAPDDGDGEVISIRSEEGFDLKLDSLERHRSGIELVGVKSEGAVTVAKLFVPRGKFVLLIRLIEAYENKTTARSGQPRNRELVESMASIRLAAVRDFWQDSVPFPQPGELLWWEVWLRASDQELPTEVHERFVELAQQRGMRVSNRFVTFPERVVTLAYGNQGDLAGSISLLSLLAELRRAKELAGDYVELAPRDQRELVDELVSRTVPPAENAPSVCILDSGVNRDHPLLSSALTVEDTQAVNPEWGTADDRSQHGTEMAGIALYGCLTHVFPTAGPVVLRHRLESVKVLPPAPDANSPMDFGPFTAQAVALAEIQSPHRDRAICMAVTADDRDLGMPSLWSGTVDQLCSGASDGTRRLMFLSAGNLREEIVQPDYEYHRWNCERGGIEDPAQAWNAITVGAFTEKVFIQQPEFSDWEPLAESGDLCPTSRTSLPWPPENQSGWPIKPDIVMEGGNYAENGADRAGVDDLSLLTTVLPPFPNQGRLLQSTRDTSPATGAAARGAAIIWSYYPGLWPETVRALIVQSARWTDRMLVRFPDTGRASVQRRLRCYGYGVPQLQRALWSAENAATLIYEGELNPYHKVISEVRSNEMHVHRLPWPAQVLEDLAEAQVTLRVTLSYFVEPSPGRIGWTRKHRYQSHGLRFEVNRPLEGEEAFRQRLSRAEWDAPDERPDNAAETRNWAIGDQGRRRGSLHSDWWTGNAVELASTNLIAVYPVTGWWRERPHLDSFNKSARYSLIVSLEAPELEVDLYTAIVNQVEIVAPIEH